MNEFIRFCAFIVYLCQNSKCHCKSCAFFRDHHLSQGQASPRTQCPLASSAEAPFDFFTQSLLSSLEG